MVAVLFWFFGVGLFNIKDLRFFLKRVCGLHLHCRDLCFKTILLNIRAMWAAVIVCPPGLSPPEDKDFCPEGLTSHTHRFEGPVNPSALVGGCQEQLLFPLPSLGQWGAASHDSSSERRSGIWLDFTCWYLIVAAWEACSHHSPLSRENRMDDPKSKGPLFKNQDTTCPNFSSC